MRKSRLSSSCSQAMDSASMRPMAAMLARTHALLEERRRLRIEIDLVAQKRKPHIGLARIAGDRAERHLEHGEPEHRVDGRDHLRHAKDERLARAEHVLGRLDTGRRRGIGDAAHRGRDQRREIGDFRARAVEPEQDAQQHLPGTDEHGGAVARHALRIIVHGDDAAGAGHVLYHHVRLAFEMAGQPVGDDAAVEVGAAAGREADQHLELLALIERRLRRGRSRSERQRQGGGHSEKKLRIDHVLAALAEPTPSRYSLRTAKESDVSTRIVT